MWRGPEPGSGVRHAGGARERHCGGFLGLRRVLVELDKPQVAAKSNRAALGHAIALGRHRGGGAAFEPRVAQVHAGTVAGEDATAPRGAGAVDEGDPVKIEGAAPLHEEVAAEAPRVNDHAALLR